MTWKLGHSAYKGKGVYKVYRGISGAEGEQGMGDCGLWGLLLKI